MHKIYILVNIQSKNGLECYWLLNKHYKHVSNLIHVKEMCIIRRNRLNLFYVKNLWYDAYSNQNIK